MQQQQEVTDPPLLSDQILPELWAIVVFEMLDVVDLMTVFETVATRPPLGAVFVAPRTLTASELEWFVTHHVRVVLRVECHLNDANRERWLSRALPSEGYLSQTKKVWTLNDAPHRDNDLPAMELAIDEGFVWYQYGKIHRDGDRPAMELADGYRAWWQRGQHHRDGGRPAILRPNGEQIWCWRGKNHRDGDLPAVVHKDYQCWFQHGKLHRDGDLPAVVYINGTQEWYRHGKQHRDGGLPAVINTIDGRTEFWVNGVRMNTTTTDDDGAVA